MSADPTVIVGGARTGMGRLLGSLKDFSATDLGGFAIAGALEKSGVSPEQVDYVIMGQVLQAGAGQMPARQSAVNAGIPMDVPSITINKVCLSGLDAIALADQLIRAGEVEIVVAGGQESMTNAPHLLLKTREGYKYGDVTMRDHMAYDGLWDVFTDQAMGALTDQANTGEYAFSREEQDAFAARSHELAARAWKDGVFDDEVVSVSIPQRKGDPLEYKADEGVRADTSVEVLGRLRPAFSKDGTITAGSASPISDGAAAVVVMKRSKAESWASAGWLRSAATASSPARTRPCRPSRPTRSARPAPRRASTRRTSTSSRSTRRSPRSRSRRPRTSASTSTRSTSTVGAIATGHPIGMSGARLVLHLALELKRRGGGVGAAALCGGGGQGDALVVRVPAAS